MKTSESLSQLYESYYGDENPTLDAKRTITARQTVRHMRELLPGPFQSFLDVGAGDGSVLVELDRVAYAAELHALEISNSGLQAIQARNIGKLRSASIFDGYRIDAPDKHFDVASAIHVLEHVEHERAFLHELGRVAKQVYVEVPTEHTFRVRNAIMAGPSGGHINFYSPPTLRNLLETSGLEVTALRVFSHVREYEVSCSGNAVGTVKHAVRSGLLRVLPSLAPQIMAYVAIAVCKQRRSA